MRTIRNFSIIAHIDHGKSTLADCFIRACRGLADREMTSQVLDKMDLERERGITIKAQTASLLHQDASGRQFRLNLIDTPGHADFSYEVSRSLAACEGALLVVDAAQGVQAQTIANSYKAVGQGLEIIPVLNKIDLPAADVDRVAAQIRDIVGIDTGGLLLCSAKSGVGISELLSAIVERIPPPAGEPGGRLRALVVDSWFDAYAGVVMLLRIVDGSLGKGDRISFMAGGSSRVADVLGRFTPRATPCPRLEAGEVGYVIAGIKDLAQARVGDTVTLAAEVATTPLPGFKRLRPQLYASFYPTESDRFPQLREAFERLRLNDSALEVEPESSPALGQGLRCGFLGMLHMEIVQERLAREHDAESLITAPSVTHEVELASGTVEMIYTPSQLPTPDRIREIREPIADTTVLVPDHMIGAVIQLCVGRRGTQTGIEQTGSQALMRWRMPLAELVTGFVGELLSATHGYASLDYELAGYRVADIVRLDVLVNGERVDPLAVLVVRPQAERRGRELAERLARAIPRQQFEIPVQAAIGGKIIARKTVKALRKNVLAKCYGGDVTRKRKLLERQKRGKKRMRMIGSVELPQEAFLSVLGSSGSDDG